jgi:iron(III) transport system permease protein
VLELLNDYGVVQYFGIPAFSTAIFTTWFSMGDLNTAVRLASILMSIALTLVLLEKLLRGRRRYSETNSRGRRAQRKKLGAKAGAFASAFGLLVFALGFGIPVLQMLYWASQSYSSVISSEFAGYMVNTVGMALLGATAIAVIALVIGNYNRMANNSISKVYSKVTILGYSIPGAVIAVGVIVSFIALDGMLYPAYRWFDPDSKKLVLSSSIVMLGFAYVVRFLGVGFGPIESGYDRMGKRYLEASRTLGMNTLETFFKVDIPILKGSIMAAVSLVFLEIIKELPLTLILRPFNFHTLATRSYQYANDEMLPESAVPSLFIVAIGFLSVYIIQNAGRRRKR